MIRLNEFNKNVAKVLSGTFFAQLLPFILAPILARIYEVEAFGEYYAFAAIVSILGSISTGKYEMAILNPKAEQEAIGLAQAAILISFITNLIVFVLIILFPNTISDVLGITHLSNILWLAPVAAFLLASGLVFSFLLNRAKAFGKLTKGKIVLSSLTNFSRLGMGLATLGTLGLILSLIIGYLAQLLYMIRHINGPLFQKNQNKQERQSLLKSYSDFPKSMVPATLLNKSSNDLPPILIKSFFSGQVAGWYGQMVGLLRKPIAIIGRAFEEVYRQGASEQIKAKGHCSPIFYSTLKKLFLIGIIPFGALFFIAPDLFALVLGDKWLESGLYARYFALPLFLQFVAYPLSSTFYLLSKNKWLSYLEFLQLGLILAAFGTSLVLKSDSTFLILGLSIAYSIAYLCKIISLQIILKRVA